MDQQAESLGPILTAHLFPKLEGMLIELLRSLRPDDWNTPTISPKWNVKDVVAHLLDTHLRKLSSARDGCAAKPPVLRNPGDLVAYVDQLNAQAVTFYRRLSPPVLTSLMEVASRESAEYYRTLDPFAPARIGVSWAGEAISSNWFDTARELTERWHHQQQIRLAVNRPGIMTPELYHPVLDCFMRALPFAYRDVPAVAGTVLQFDISGECGGTWWLQRDGNSWRLVNRALAEPASRVTIPHEIAWRVFTKGIDRKSAAAQAQVEGDRQLGSPVLLMTAIVG